MHNNKLLLIILAYFVYSVKRNVAGEFFISLLRLIWFFLMKFFEFAPKYSYFSLRFNQNILFHFTEIIFDFTLSNYLCVLSTLAVSR